MVYRLVEYVAKKESFCIVIQDLSPSF